jgi:hypothetical protein
MSIALNTPRRNTPRGLLLAALTLTACLLAAPLFAAPMTDTDREHLLVHFEMTTQMVAEQVRGLSPAQLEYKASPDRWTIRQVVSHLAVAEPDYWREIQKALKAAPDMKDKKSTWYIPRPAVGTKKSTPTRTWMRLSGFSGAARHHDRIHQDHHRRHACPQLW